MTNYYFLPHLFVRTASVPVDTEQFYGEIMQVFYDESFQTALKLSSPSLFVSIKALERGEVKKEKDKQKTLYALTKYALRYCSRPTPFGLFAGISSARWDSETNLVRSVGFRTYCRLDIGFLSELADKLSALPEIESYLVFRPNSSIYAFSGEYRYYEYQIENGQRKYKITAIEADEILDEILSICKKGITKKELEDYLLNQGFTIDEIRDYLSELIETRFLVSELEPNLTGEDFFYRIIRVIDRVANESGSPLLYAVKSNLEELHNELNLANGLNMESLLKLENLIGRLPVTYSKKLHVDKFDEWSRCSLSIKIQEELFYALRVMKRLNKRSSLPNVEDFKRRFERRFGEQEVPLLLALDSDVGVGFGGYGTVALPLIDSVNFDINRAEEVHISSSQKVLLDWLIKNEGREQVLRLESFWQPVPEEELNLCPTISIGFRLLSESMMYLENVGGQSGANIIARFAGGDSSIEEALSEIHDQEKSENPDVIFAEVVHLPESHLGNVMRRPSFRPNEIAFLAGAGVSAEHQIDLADITIKLIGETLILTDSKSGQRIIPRLGSAFNYLMGSIPAFEFLCSVQNDGYETALGFNWGVLEELFIAFPRVTVKNVVVSPAQWVWKERQLKKVNSVNKLKSLILESAIPRYFVFAQGDQELLVDAQNEWLLEVLLNEILGKEKVVLKEFLHNDQNPVKDLNNLPLAHQFVSTLVRKGELFKPYPTLNSDIPVKRFFSPGSEWIYFKIYGGYRSLENILMDIEKDILRFCQSGVLDKWFFIRYEDPDPHLRVRVRLCELSGFSEVLRHFASLLDQARYEGKLSSWCLDSYERELERFGKTSIDQVESFFQLDSQMVCQMLKSVETEEDRNLEVIRIIDLYLNAAGLGLDARQKFIEEMRDQFMEELGGKELLKPQIDRQYREWKSLIFERLEMNTNENSGKTLIVEILNKIKAKLTTAEWSRVLGSFLHLHINRSLPLNQRRQELVIYDFLAKYYTTVIAIRKNTTT